MIRYSVILSCCIGILLSASASFAQQNHSKSKLSAEQLHKLIDSLSKELEQLDEDGSASIDTLGFGNLFQGFDSQDFHLDQSPNLLLPKIQPPSNNYLIPKLPDGFPFFPAIPPPPQKKSEPVPDFPGWRIELLKYIYQRV
jgi:hypothetical protein